MIGLRDFLGSKLGLTACLVLAVLGGYLLWTHTGHVLSAIPYVFLLACPLLHLFGHGHGHQHGHNGDRASPEAEKNPASQR
jgi:hypothetical protein